MVYRKPVEVHYHQVGCHGCHSEQNLARWLYFARYSRQSKAEAVVAKFKNEKMRPTPFSLAGFDSNLQEINFTEVYSFIL